MSETLTLREIMERSWEKSGLRDSRRPARFFQARDGVVTASGWGLFGTDSNNTDVVTLTRDGRT